MSNKRYKKDRLIYDLPFEIYYNKSLNLAKYFPHLVHILDEDIILDEEIVKKRSVLFYNTNGNKLEIFSIDEWENDRKNTYYNTEIFLDLEKYENIVYKTAHKLYLETMYKYGQISRILMVYSYIGFIYSNKFKEYYLIKANKMLRKQKLEKILNLFRR